MAIHEIRVTPVDGDPLGHEVRQEAERTLSLVELEDVRTAKVYRVQGATGNYNMGAGFAIYTPKDQVKHVVDIAAGKGLTAWHAGNVEAGTKQVIVEPKGLSFGGQSLGVRS